MEIGNLGPVDLWAEPQRSKIKRFDATCMEGRGVAKFVVAAGSGNLGS